MSWEDELIRAADEVEVAPTPPRTLRLATETPEGGFRRGTPSRAGWTPDAVVRESPDSLDDVFRDSPQEELDEIAALFEDPALQGKFVREWLVNGGRHIGSQARGMVKSMRDEMVEAGRELHECGKDALGMAAAMPEAAGLVKQTVTKEIAELSSTAVGMVAAAQDLGAKAWSTLDTLDALFTRALLDDSHPEEAPVLEFEVEVHKSKGQILGLAVKWLEDVDGPVVITAVQHGGLVDGWNWRKAREDLRVVRRSSLGCVPAVLKGVKVMPGDFLVSINGVSLVGCDHSTKGHRLRSLGKITEYNLGVSRVLKR